MAGLPHPQSHPHHSGFALLQHPGVATAHPHPTFITVPTPPPPPPPMPTVPPQHLHFQSPFHSPPQAAPLVPSVAPAFPPPQLGRPLFAATAFRVSDGVPLIAPHPHPSAPQPPPHPSTAVALTHISNTQMAFAPLDVRFR